MPRDGRVDKLFEALGRCRTYFSSGRSLRADVESLISASEQFQHSGYEVTKLREARDHLDKANDHVQFAGNAVREAMSARVDETNKEMRESSERRKAETR